MKHIKFKRYIGTALASLFLVGCSDILEENPRAIFTPDYFSTTEGVMGGVTSMYGHLRYMYGNGYFLNVGQIATDESTWGQNSDGNVKNLDFSGVGTIDPSTSNTGAVWNNAFPNINTASGVIENASKISTISNSLIAEARFFRAFDYFLLVQTYGGVPLDLGAGELKFNSSTMRSSVRNTVPQVYSKAIFPDLLKAVEDLPVAGRVTGGVTKTVARLYLAKAYLTFGWWLENPNSIPTYPAADRVDLDGHNAAWYFQQAYDVAAAAISDPGPFGLQPSFYDVNVATKDRNNEMLLYADHTQSSAIYNGGDLSYSGGGFSTDYFASWFGQFNYTGVRSSTSATSWASVSSVQREAEQHLGRPWTMLAPPIEVFKNTFADKTNDSRYDGTFVTVYRGNWAKAGIAATVLYNANYLPIKNGEPVLTFLDNDTGGINYTNTTFNSSIGAGVLPGRADFVIEPSYFSRICYPGNWKLGPYRTDNGTGLGSPNGSTTRPFPIAKFSELYFIAAEAAVKGAAPQGGKTARDLINVIRARAGKWTFNNNANTVKSQDNSTAMTTATPAVIDIDYILAERSREYFGEGYRWYDLARTQKWIQYGASFTIAGATNPNDWKDHSVKTFTRTIAVSNYLRPIPTSQLDGMEISAADKKAYQNPGY
ncbi:RagB/SusD family nutrient uptake outer membrane protein [Flavobacterium sp. MC2016-06]|uniref:RagB/SusD family nutrient uptake outer membrane protein n=1 Tax=Flavobacterium sp. MC2016-06 TaxID=2676308 RepID=UPI0012BB1681|nr:RagB/SusD family nutrient uptake outer membrane protein [Flavobacterium sp. MC2016-06]MBU3860783.1 RagB/SusD family nutrient uptake outer membrane protein [Flavobacterium sp. MC2016-06]